MRNKPSTAQIPEPHVDIAQSQLRSLQKQTPLLNAISAFWCLALAFVFAGSTADHFHLGSLPGYWPISILALIVLHTLTTPYLRRTASDQIMLGHEMLHATLMGCAWGALSYVIEADSRTSALSHIIPIGLVIVSVAVYSSFFRVFCCFAMPIISASLFWFYLHGQEGYHVLILASAVLSIFLTFSARYINRMFLRALSLQARNQALINNLEEANIAADHLNRQLVDEVEQRREAERALQTAREKLESEVALRTQDLSVSNAALLDNQERLRLALKTSQIVLWDWKTDEHTLQQYDNDVHLLGYTPEEQGDFIAHLKRIMGLSEFANMKSQLVAHLKGEQPHYDVTFKAQSKTGEWRWLRDTGQVIERDGDRATRMIGTRRDITHEKRAEEELTLASQVYENVTEAIFILDTQFFIQNVNPYFCRLIHVNDSDVLGRSALSLPALKNNGEKYANIIQHLIAFHFWQGEIKEQLSDGLKITVWMKINAIFDQEGRVKYYLGIMSDLSEIKATQRRLSYLENYDVLTGLGNRSFLKERLFECLQEAKTNGSKLALLALDIDRFNQYNESLGATTGDNILQHIAAKLSQLSERFECSCRVGSDDFMLVFSHWYSTQQIDGVCKTILNTLSEPFYINDHEITISASIGISLFPSDTKEMETLIKQANMALLKAKRTGGGDYQYYMKNLGGDAVAKLKLESKLRRAIAANSLEVYYQPKLNLQTRRIDSVEALARWHHHRLGWITPHEFISLAEDVGLIHGMGEHIFRKACLMTKDWQDRGYDISVAINLSVIQFHRQDLLGTLTNIIDTTQVSPEHLEIEITESVFMDNVDEHLEVINALRERGVRITLDDFGTGYSSLKYLKDFPVHTVKIDQSFINSIANNHRDAAITKSIITMAHGLDMKVVAEGVENVEQYAFLEKHSCDLIQGYLVSEALPPDQVVKLFGRHPLHLETAESASPEITLN